MNLGSATSELLLRPKSLSERGFKGKFVNAVCDRKVCRDKL